MKKLILIIAIVIAIASEIDAQQITSANNYNVIYVDGNNAEAYIKASTKKVVQFTVKLFIKAKDSSELEINHKEGFATTYVVSYRDKVYHLDIVDEREDMERYEFTSVKDTRDKIVELILTE